jgi:vitamin B12 transporter
MRHIRWATALVLLLAATAAAGGAGGVDYGYPFAAGSVLYDYPGTRPFATVTMIEVTGEDLVAQGAQTAADALELAGGAYVYHADRWPGRGGRMARLRGAGPSGVAVFVDGVPYNHGVFDNVDLESIPADQISRLRVYPGPAPTVFGAEAGVGVVEIITREAAKKFTTQFDANFGDKRRQAFSFGVGDSEDWARYWGSGSYFTRNGVLAPLGYDHTRGEDGGTREATAAGRNHYRGRFGVVATDTSEVHATMFFDRLDRDVAYDAINPQEDYRRFPENQRLGGVLNWRLGAFGPFNMTGQAYVTEFREVREDYADTQYTDLLREVNYRHLRAGAGLTPFFNFGQESRVTLRLSGRQDQIESFVQDLAAPRERFTTQRVAASLTEEFEPLPWLQVRLGGGYESVQPTRTSTRKDDGGRDGTHGRVGAGFGPFSGVSVYGSITQNPRFPTLEEAFDVRLGNPKLEPELIDHAELGVTWDTTGKTQLGAVGFWRRTRDGIVLVENANRELFENDLEWSTMGVTGRASTQPVQGLYLAAQATWQDYAEAGASKDVQPLYMPRVYGSADARYRFPFGLGASAQVVGAGERQDYEAAQEVTMEPYAVTNARLFYSYRDKVEVYTEGRNLLNVAYETKRFFPEPGRAWLAGIRMIF